MCKQICDNIPLTIISLIALTIVIVDVGVLKKTLSEYQQLSSYLDGETYSTCYKPQALMRIVFQCYVIYSASAITILTSTLAMKLSDEMIDFVARITINVTYFLFGPILLVFVNYGFTHFKNFAFVCSPRGITHQINFVDIVLILFCFVFALCVTFTMAMQKTLDMAQASFTDENSLMYRLTSSYFSYTVRRRAEQERDENRQRQQERREARERRQEEREAILAEYAPKNDKNNLGRVPNAVPDDENEPSDYSYEQYNQGQLRMIPEADDENFAHFDELDRLLNEQPDLKNKQDYKASSGVLSTNADSVVPRGPISGAVSSNGAPTRTSFRE